MIKLLKKSLEIDITYSTNSILYILRQLPVLKDLITKDIYGSRGFKSFIRVVAMIWMFLKSLLFKFFYFFCIFSFVTATFPDAIIKSYFHIYFVLTVLGIFLNNKLLNMNKKLYISIVLFQMDGTKYLRSMILWNQFLNFILNSICMFFFGHLLSSPIQYSISLIVLTFFARLIGEALNIWYYQKYHYIWYSNLKLYWTIVLGLLAVTALPGIDIYIPFVGIMITTGCFVLLGSFAFRYLWKIANYKLFIHKISSVTNIMDTKNDKDYLRQAMVSVREKDKEIDAKKIEGKKGYDLFNTIFFERHKEILLRSAKKYSVICIGIYIVASYVCLQFPEYHDSMKSFLETKLGWFFLVMYFINRGAIITQAMFFNCDHSMLTYNFYREPNTVLGLFRKRLSTVVKVNLLPAAVIGVGNLVLLFLLGNTEPVTFITTFFYIIFLSVFFSVHYMVIYYLLQPFNKNLEVKKASYSIATFITYFVSYMATDIVMNSLMFSIIGLTFTILYIMISLFLVYRYAPKTFKLN